MSASSTTIKSVKHSGEFMRCGKNSHLKIGKFGNHVRIDAAYRKVSF